MVLHRFSASEQRFWRVPPLEALPPGRQRQQGRGGHTSCLHTGQTIWRAVASIDTFKRHGDPPTNCAAAAVANAPAAAYGMPGVALATEHPLLLRAAYRPYVRAPQPGGLPRHRPSQNSAQASLPAPCRS
jgi:hypothetical protein